MTLKYVIVFKVNSHQEPQIILKFWISGDTSSSIQSCVVDSNNALHTCTIGAIVGTSPRFCPYASVLLDGDISKSLPKNVGLGFLPLVRGLPLQKIVKPSVKSSACRILAVGGPISIGKVLKQRGRVTVGKTYKTINNCHRNAKTSKNET